MSRDNDPAKFWRDNSMYHQQRADFWKKTSRILSAVLAVILVTMVILVKST